MNPSRTVTIVLKGGESFTYSDVRRVERRSYLIRILRDSAIEEFYTRNIERYLLRESAGGGAVASSRNANLAKRDKK